MYLTKKILPGATIIEVVTGFLLIALCISLSTTLIGQVLYSANRINRQKAVYEINTFTEYYKTGVPTDTIIHRAGYIIEIISGHTNINCLTHIRITATDYHGRKLTGRQIYIIEENN